MAGFAAALGGFGQGIGSGIGALLPILAQRREGLANLLLNVSNQTWDPNTKAELIQHASDLYGGKKRFGDILQGIGKTAQAHAEDQQKLATVQKAISPVQGQASEPAAGPAGPGQTPGTIGQAATAPAAQPSTSPVQGGNDLDQALNGGGQAPAIAPVQANPQAPAPLTPVGGGGGGPEFELNPEEKRLMDTYHSFANSGFGPPPTLEAAVKPIMDRMAALQQAKAQQQIALSLGPERLKVLQSPEAQAFAQQLRAQGYPEMSILPAVGAAFGMNIPMMPGLAGLAYTPEKELNVEGANAPKGTLDIFGQPVTQGPYTTERPKLGGPIQWIPEAKPNTVGFDASGNGVLASRYGAAGTPTGTVAPSLVAPRAVGNNASGNPLFQTGAQLLGMTPGVEQGAGVNPAFIPTIKTTSTPGEAPTTTRTSKGTGGGTSAVGGAGFTGSDIVKREYDDWAAGGPAPTGRKLTAVQEYADKAGLPTPTQLSPRGQADLSALDPVIQEIDRTKAMLEDAIKNGLTKPQMAARYAQYAYLHMNSPETALISNLSFADLRSAAQAMKGTGSRAERVLNRALEHTPVVGLNPDDPQMMLSKLNEMRTRLTEGRQSIMDEERKSGTLPAPGAGAIGPVTINTKAEYDKLPSGSTYIDAADGKTYKKK